MADQVSGEQLSRALHEADISILLIDTRSFMEFNLSHIQTAHNVHCPPIVKRRSGGSLSLENILRCPTTRAKLRAGGYNMVVVYDENTTSVSDLPSDSNMALVLRSLSDEPAVKSLCFLEGKFVLFCPIKDLVCCSCLISLLSRPEPVRA